MQLFQKQESTVKCMDHQDSGWGRVEEGPTQDAMGRSVNRAVMRVNRGRGFSRFGSMVCIKHLRQ